MKTEKELNEAIIAITTTIQEKHPELIKFITEMPVTNPDEEHPKITIERLEDYYNSLKTLLQNYDVNHLPNEHNNGETND